MSESLNADVAQELTERHGGDRHKERWERLVEVIEVAVLAVVATTTAWSGYQAAKWSGREASLYQEATAYRFRAEAASTLGGLEITSDSALFTAWLQAEADGDAVLQHNLERRFTPDFRADFERWQQAGTDAAAEQDVGFSPDYRNNANVQEASRLNERSSALFVRGKAADTISDKYVRNTVLLATILFLVAIAQRLPSRGLRIGVNIAICVLLGYVVIATLTLPKIV